MPAGHWVGTSAELGQKWPAGHETQYAQLESEYVPFSQRAGALPVDEQKWPAGHATHSSPPPSEYEPGEHGCGAPAASAHE